MRISPYWKDYNRTEEQYRAMNCKVPVSVKANYRTKEFLDALSRRLHECADGNAISNATWNIIAKIQETERDQNMSKQMEKRLESTKKGLVCLNAELKEAENKERKDISFMKTIKTSKQQYRVIP